MAPRPASGPRLEKLYGLNIAVAARLYGPSPIATSCTTWNEMRLSDRSPTSRVRETVPE